MKLTLEELKDKRKQLKELPSRRKLTRKYKWDKDQFDFICKWSILAVEKLNIQFVTEQYLTN